MKYCSQHKDQKLDENNFCGIGHIAERYVWKPGSKKEPFVRDAGPRPVPDAPKVAVTPTVLKEPPIMRPRRFTDDQGRIMILSLRQTKSGGWAICCQLRNGRKLLQKGPVRVHGDDLEAAKRSFAELASSAEKAGWVSAPMGAVKLISIPEPVRNRH